MINRTEMLIYSFPYDGKFALPFEHETKSVWVCGNVWNHNALTGRILVTFPNGATVAYPDLDMAQRAVDKARDMVW